MSVLILLIAFSILIAGGFLAAFIWSVKKGQFDDDYTPSVRMLFDDDPKVSDTSLVSDTCQSINKVSDVVKTSDIFPKQK